jgi:hypothetical protein
MTRLSSFTFTLTDGQEATFLAPTHSQALELAITWSRARGVIGLPSDHEKDRVAWDLPEAGPTPTRMPGRAGPNA